MTKTLVSIIIPVYNGKDYIKNCLDHLFKNTLYPKYEVIVVNDASTDGGEEFLRSFKKVGRIKLIENEKNLGFARTCNDATSIANGDYLVFLNMDTLPLPGWLSEMIKLLESDEEIAACGGKWLYPGIDRIQHAGGAIVFDEKGRILDHYHLYRYAPSFIKAVNKTREVPSLSGAAVSIRKDIFFDIKGFDERFFCGIEDVDLWLRVKEKGYKLVYCPKSVVIHYEEVSQGRNDYDAQNLDFLRKKWEGRLKVKDNLGKYWLEDGYDIELIHRIEKEVGIDLVFLGVNEEDDLKIGKKDFSMLAFKERMLKNAGFMAEKFLNIKPRNDNFLARSILLLVNILLLQAKFKEAEEKLKEALSLELADRSPILFIYYSMGSNYERQGKLNEAIEKFEHVVNSESISIKLKGGAHFHLGCIYKELGERQEAKYHLKECLKIIPDHKKAKENLAKL